MDKLQMADIIGRINGIWQPPLMTKPEFEIWGQAIGHLDHGLVKTVLVQLSTTCEFRPSPAGIVKAVAQITGTARLSASEAWAEHVRPILSRYTPLEQIEALPADIRQAVNKAGRLSYLGTLPEETARKAFMGAYNALTEAKEREELIKLAGGHMQIGGGHGETQRLCHLPG